MNEFWLLTAGLTILAILFVLVPYRLSSNKRQPTVSTHENQNVEIFKERAAEIKRDKENALISATEYSQQLAELESKLISDTKGQQKDPSEKPFRLFSILMGGILLAIPLSAYLIYFELGASDEVYKTAAFNDKGSKRPLPSETDTQEQDVDALLSSLHQKLLADPDRLEGWSLLARSAMNTNKFDLAVEAYEQIIRLLEAQSESTAPIYGLLAQAQYYLGNAEFNKIVQSAVDNALSRDPNEINALGLLAIHHYSIDDYQAAISYWEQIVVTSPEHPSRKSIEAGINRARYALGETTIAKPIDIASTDKPVAKLTINLSLAPEFRSLVEPNDVVFVFAKDANTSGPSMPLAAKKMKIRDLPATIALSDADAMGPMAKLTDATNVSVSARVSFSGQPIASSGDLEAISQVLSLSDDQDLNLEINTKRP